MAEEVKQNAKELDFCCMKYKTMMIEKDAKCCDPTIYCKHRTACLIWFMEQEKEENG